MKDFGLTFDTNYILCDNISAINLSKNSIFHSHTIHSDVRHHFLKDHVKYGDIKLYFETNSFGSKIVVDNTELLGKTSPSRGQESADTNMGYDLSGAKA